MSLRRAIISWKVSTPAKVTSVRVTLIHKPFVDIKFHESNRPKFLYSVNEHVYRKIIQYVTCNLKQYYKILYYELNLLDKVSYIFLNFMKL